MVLYNIMKNIRCDGDYDGDSFINDVIDKTNAVGYYANLANKMNEENDTVNCLREFCRIINCSIDQWPQGR